MTNTYLFQAAQQFPWIQPIVPWVPWVWLFSFQATDARKRWNSSSLLCTFAKPAPLPHFCEIQCNTIFLLKLPGENTNKKWIFVVDSRCCQFFHFFEAVLRCLVDALDFGQIIFLHLEFRSQNWQMNRVCCTKRIIISLLFFRKKKLNNSIRNDSCTICVSCQFRQSSLVRLSLFKQRSDSFKSIVLSHDDGPQKHDRSLWNSLHKWHYFGWDEFFSDPFTLKVAAVMISIRINSSYETLRNLLDLIPLTIWLMRCDSAGNTKAAAFGIYETVIDIAHIFIL